MPRQPIFMEYGTYCFIENLLAKWKLLVYEKLVVKMKPLFV